MLYHFSILHTFYIFLSTKLRHFFKVFSADEGTLFRLLGVLWVIGRREQRLWEGWRCPMSVYLWNAAQIQTLQYKF